MRRAAAGDNRSVTRVSVPADAALDGSGAGAEALSGAAGAVVRATAGTDDDRTVPARPRAADPLAARVRALRDGLDLAAEGLVAPARPREFRFTPCPRNDFNGAEFLYFASFAALLDRAAWDWWREPPGLLTADREIAFSGNLNAGETLVITLTGLHADGPAAGHACELRAGDGRLLARAITRRASAPLPRCPAARHDVGHTASHDLQP